MVGTDYFSARSNSTKSQVANKVSRLETVCVHCAFSSCAVPGVSPRSFRCEWLRFPQRMEILMRTLLHSAVFIRSVHAAIFVIMGGLLLGFLLEVILDHITPLTWIAVVVLLLEGVVLMLNGWRCPLGTY